jgi:hypothetical protein
MKNQAECWKALLGGETLVSKGGAEISLVDGNIQNRSGVSHNISMPELWSIKEKPKMYCKFKSNTTDNTNNVQVTEIYYLVNSREYHNFKRSGWTECKHKTFEEI